MPMHPATRRMAGLLFVVFPTVVYGGVSLLRLLVGEPAYVENQLRRDLWRAGHAHAGLLLVLSLVVLRYVDEAQLSPRSKAIVRHAVPLAAILLPLAFFGSVLSPEATEPNGLIHLAYAAAVALTLGLALLGFGLLRPGSDGV